MTTRQAKMALRREIRARILGLPPEERARQEAAIVRAIPGLPGLPGAGTVLMYAPSLPEEVRFATVFDDLRDRGQALVFPRVDREARCLRLHRVDDPRRDLLGDDGRLREPPPKAPEVEPASVDWALVPGLAFDPLGFRLGRGAGYYDRLLPLLRPEVPTWAVLLEVQWVDRVPIDPHDVPVRGLCSPSRLRYVDGRSD